jgi:hypothetical protein
MKWLADNVVDHVWRDGTLAILLILLAMVFLLILARLSTSAHERTRRRIFDVWGRILDYGLGYGYLPGRAVFLSAMVVISGGFIYKHAASEGHFRPVDARRFDPNWAVPEPPMAGQPPKPREMRPPPPDTYPALNPLLYSFEQFVPFIALKHVQYWELDGASPPWLHAYKTLHILLGYILVTAVALSPVAIFRKD